MKKVGYHAFLGTNYGSVLQAFALYTKVRQLGFECELLGAGWYLDRPIPSESEKLDNPKEFDKKLMRVNFERFIRKNFSVSLNFYRLTQNKIQNSEKLQKALMKFDSFVCGSDQIWNPNEFWFKPENYLQFSEKSKRISYAPSIGYITLPEKLNGYLPNWKQWISDIPYLSVREKSSADILERLIGRRPEVVIDPTLLISPECWLNSLSKPEYSKEIRKILEKNVPFMIAYLLDNLKEYETFVIDIAKKMGLEIIWLTGRDWIGPVTRNCAETDPSGFVHLFSKAKFACVDGFHGSCFSINFSVPFILLSNEEKLKNDSRMNDLYKRLGVVNRVVTLPCIAIDKIKEMDYKLIQMNLEKERRKSEKFLSISLNESSKTGISMQAVKTNNELKEISPKICYNYNDKEKDDYYTNTIYESVVKGVCTGCSACVNTCPKKSIAFMKNRYGYYIPNIDKTKCNKCGLCRKICPALNLNNNRNSDNPELWAFIAKDKRTLEESSSGGICNIITEDVLDKNGAVAGCTWVDDNGQLTAKHVLITEHKTAYKLNKSKYVQSFMGDIFSEIKSSLLSKKKVLFIGCACQVVGLKSFLKSDYDNLITIDILCAHVPSQRMFYEYLAWRFGELPTSFEFRDKEKGNWESYTSKVTMSDDSIFYLSMDSDPYMKAFHKHIMCPYHCEKCKYQEIPRYGDLSVGDFWGISRKDPEIQAKFGVSAILVNSPKGKELLNSIPSEKIGLCKKVPLEWLGGNGSALKGWHNWASIGRNTFYQMLNEYGFKSSFDIACLTADGLLPDNIKGSKLLSVNNQNAIFSFYSKNNWECIKIWNKNYLFPSTRNKGNYAFIRLKQNTIKLNDYILNLIFRVGTRSKVITFWLLNTVTNKIQCINESKINPINSEETIIINNKFYANDVYDAFMIGSSQIYGNMAFITFDRISIIEQSIYEM